MDKFFLEDNVVGPENARGSALDAGKFFQPPAEIRLYETESIEFFGEDLAKDVVGFLNSLNQEIHVYQEGVFAHIRPILEDYLLETLIFLLESSEHDDACLDVFSIEGETIFSKTTDAESFFNEMKVEINAMQSILALETLLARFSEERQREVKALISDQLSLLTPDALDRHFMHIDARKSITENARALSENLFKHCPSADTLDQMQGLISPQPEKLHGMQAVLFDLLVCDFSYKVSYKYVVSAGFDSLIDEQKNIPGAYSAHSVPKLVRLFLKTHDISGAESRTLQSYNEELFRRIQGDKKPIVPICLKSGDTAISLYDVAFFAPEGKRDSLANPGSKFVIVMVDFSNGEQNQILPFFDPEAGKFSCETIMSNGFTCKASGLTGEI